MGKNKKFSNYVVNNGYPINSNLTVRMVMNIIETIKKYNKPIPKNLLYNKSPQMMKLYENFIPKLSKDHIIAMTHINSMVKNVYGNRLINKIFLNTPEFDYSNVYYDTPLVLEFPSDNSTNELKLEPKLEYISMGCKIMFGAILLFGAFKFITRNL